MGDSQTGCKDTLITIQVKIDFCYILEKNAVNKWHFFATLAHSALLLKTTKEKKKPVKTCCCSGTKKIGLQQAF